MSRARDSLAGSRPGALDGPGAQPASRLFREITTEASNSLKTIARIRRK